MNTKNKPQGLKQEKLRIDKWLWAARFFKTRRLATEAVSGGKIHLNKSRIKPAHSIHQNDVLTIRKGDVEWEITVIELSSKRGPATEAQKLYQETDTSVTLREASAKERSLLRAAMPSPERRPDKKQRRQIHRFQRKS